MNARDNWLFHDWKHNPWHFVDGVIVIVMFVLFLVAQIAFWGGVAYVVLHFIAKFW